MDSKWFLASRRFWLRSLAVLALLLTAAEFMTPEAANTLATGFCAAIGDRCDPALLAKRVVAISAAVAVGLKLWRTVDPGDAAPLSLRRS